MFKFACNIDKSDRINRIVFGVLLVLGAMIGFGKTFMIVLGIVLIVEGAIGWCGVPVLVAKIRHLFAKKE